MTFAHDCQATTPSEDGAPAITDCYEREDGTLWATNGEYSSQVNFCPYCGYAAKVKCGQITQL